MSFSATRIHVSVPFLICLSFRTLCSVEYLDDLVLASSEGPGFSLQPATCLKAVLPDSGAGLPSGKKSSGNSKSICRPSVPTKKDIAAASATAAATVASSFTSRSQRAG